MINKESLENYYNILDIPINATGDEIRKAYKKLVFKYHPDVNKTDDTTEKFKEILKAYSVLKDRILRNEYDKHLSKSNGFFSNMNFKYEYKKIKEKTEGIFQKIKIVFKNITTAEIKINDDESSVNILPDEILLKMDAKELEDRLLFSDNQYVRCNSAIALGYKKNRASLNILESSIFDESYEVRKAVIFAIGKIGMKKSVHTLKKLYNSIDSNLKIDIINAVYRISGKHSFIFNNLLIRGIKDPREKVRIECIRMISKLDKKGEYNNHKKFVFDKMSESLKYN